MLHHAKQLLVKRGLGMVKNGHSIFFSFILGLMIRFRLYDSEFMSI